MAVTYEQGTLTAIDTAVQAIMLDPVTAFLAALEPGLYPIRDQAIANGLLPFSSDSDKIQWFEGATGATSLVLDVQIDADSTTEFDLSPIGAVKPNMLISFATEIIQVVSVDISGGTCEVNRGFAGTTALAQILVTVPGQVLSVTPAASEDAGDGVHVFGETKTNWLHYSEEVVRVTDESQNFGTKTPEETAAYQILDKFKMMGRQWAHQLWLSEATGGTAAIRTMDGFRAQAVTNVETSVAALLYADIDDMVETLIDIGTIPDVMYVTGAVKKAMAIWSGSRLASSFSPSTVDQAGGLIDKFQTALGPILDVEVDNSLQLGEAFICARENLHAGTVDRLSNQFVEAAPGIPSQTGVRVEKMARSGPATTLQVLTYTACQLGHEDGSGVLQGITSVDSDGV